MCSMMLDNETSLAWKGFLFSLNSCARQILHPSFGTPYPISDGTYLAISWAVVVWSDDDSIVEFHLWTVQVTLSGQVQGVAFKGEQLLFKRGRNCCAFSKSSRCHKCSRPYKSSSNSPRPLTSKNDGDSENDDNWKRVRRDGTGNSDGLGDLLPEWGWATGPIEAEY